MSLKNYNNNINESDVTDDTDSFNKSDSWSKDDKIPEILENINKIKISDPIINNIDTDLLSSIFYSESDNESNEQTNESDEQFDELDKSYMRNNRVNLKAELHTNKQVVIICAE